MPKVDRNGFSASSPASGTRPDSSDPTARKAAAGIEYWTVAVSLLRTMRQTFGSFTRSVTLPEGIEPEQIAAKFDNGVLEVRIPKPAERKAHTVAIGVGKPDVEGTSAPADEDES